MKNAIIKHCLFPAAGYGTRFLPATKSTPKEMLPIVNKPLIEYGVEEAIEAGISQITIVTGRGKTSLMEYFDHNYELEQKIKGTNKESLLSENLHVMDSATFGYVRQREIKGLGDAVLTARDLIGNNPFAVVLADDLCVDDNQGVIGQMVELYEHYGCSIVAVQEVPVKDAHQYGVIDGTFLSEDVIQVTDMVEKPKQGNEPTNLAIIGRYILTPDIFDQLDITEPGRAGEIQLTDALLKQAKERRVIAYKFKGTRFDCGSIDGYVTATNYFYQRCYRTDDVETELICVGAE